MDLYDIDDIYAFIVEHLDQFEPAYNRMPDGYISLKIENIFYNYLSLRLHSS